MKKTRQLTYKDRIIIQNYLEEEIPISVICKKIGVSKQTIYREIQRNSKEKKTNYFNCNLIDCKNRFSCPHTYDTISKRHELCTTKCSNFIPNNCDKIVKFPFVCNKCEKNNIVNSKEEYIMLHTLMKKLLIYYLLLGQVYILLKKNLNI